MADRYHVRLTAKQRRFVAEYIVCLNAAESARRAGYSLKSAVRIGQQLMATTHVRDWIRKHQDRVAQRIDISLDRILQELARIGFANVEDFLRPVGSGFVIDTGRVTRDQLAAVKKLTIDHIPNGDGIVVTRTTLELHDKAKALVDLGKHLGGFKQGLELTTPPGQPLQFEQVDVVDVARRMAFLFDRAQRIEDGTLTIEGEAS